MDELSTLSTLSNLTRSVSHKAVMPEVVTLTSDSETTPRKSTTETASMTVATTSQTQMVFVETSPGNANIKTSTESEVINEDAAYPAEDEVTIRDAIEVTEDEEIIEEEIPRAKDVVIIDKVLNDYQNEAEDSILPAAHSAPENTAKTTPPTVRNILVPQQNILLASFNRSTNFEEELVKRKNEGSTCNSWTDSQSRIGKRIPVRETIRIKVLKDIYQNASVDTVTT